MTVNPELPEHVTLLLRDIEAALGEQLVGVILYGSWSDGSAGEYSDVDLAVIVADAAAEQNRQAVMRCFRARNANSDTLSLSIESYLRVKEFLKRGDPFAWVVCTRGRILWERSCLISDLQNECRGSHANLDAHVLSEYLETKSRSHYDQAMEGFQQFMANIQLSAMAGAQAVCARNGDRDFGSDDLVALSDWRHLSQALRSYAVGEADIQKFEQLIDAHKLMRSQQESFPGKDALDLVKEVGELWEELLDKRASF